MSNKLSGINSLAYQGTNAQMPPNMFVYDRAPTTRDSQNFALGDFWLYRVSKTTNNSQLYVLLGLVQNVANWVLLSSNTGPIEQVTTDDLNVVLPVNGNINLAGGHDINTTGSGDTATVNLDNAITLGDLSPIAANDNALDVITGDVFIEGGNFKIRTASTAGTSGIIKIGGNNWIYSYGIGNAFVGESAGNTTLTVASAVQNSAFGQNALRAIETGANNHAFGVACMFNCTSGSSNAAFGAGLTDLTTGSNNTAIGDSSLDSLVDGDSNTACGKDSGLNLTGGDLNCFIGHNAGINYTSTESNNILIANPGVVGESAIIRIGQAGTHLKNFQAGIVGVTTDVNDAIAVLIDSAGQLGTVSSSERYKTNIQDMGSQSEIIYNLRPRIFNYKKHLESPAWGLIAEEVEEVFPNLVVRNDEGKPETVKYHDLPVLLLSELQRLKTRVDELERQLKEEKSDGCMG